MHYMGHSIEFDDNRCIKCTKCVMRCKTCSVGYLGIKVDENGKKHLTAKDGVKLHVDHIIPVYKGGKTTMSNLQTLCDRCNLGKSDKEN